MQRTSGNQAALGAVGGAPSQAPLPRIAPPPLPMRPSNPYRSAATAAGSAGAGAASAGPVTAGPVGAGPAGAGAASAGASSVSASSVSATGASAASSSAVGAGAAGASAAADPKVQIPADLQGRGHYKSVYDWFKQEAADDKKSALFGFFDALAPEQKIAAIDIMAGGKSSNTLDNVKRKMLKGFFSKSVDWDKFSEACRQAKKMDITNYNADKDRDYASYTAIGTSAIAGGVSGSSTISQALGAAGAKGTALSSAPVAGVLGGAAAISQVYNATQNYDESLSTAGKTQQVVGEGMGGAADLARISAGTVNSVRALGGMAANGAATIAGGVAGVAGGAAYMVSGAAGYLEGRRNAKQLGQIEERLAGDDQNDLTKQQLLAAGLGRSTQEMNKSKSGMTALKGAAMIAGGAVMLAAAASPIGPALIALGAILGGVAAIVKFYRKHKRKEAFIDKVLKVDEAAALPENKDVPREKVRQAILEKNGYNNVGQCYSQLVTDMAGMLYDSGVKGDNKESMQIIENLGLKIDKDKQKPDKALIAKKLHT